MNILRKRKSGSGFTLIELLVVIAIIGILAAVVLVSLNSARAKARDAKRVADTKQMMTALELYYNDNNGYPAALSALVPTYMAATPVYPTPADGTSCAGVTTYGYTGSATTYSITFCLGNLTGGLGATTHTATPGGIN